MFTTLFISLSILFSANVVEAQTAQSSSSKCSSPRSAIANWLYSLNEEHYSAISAIECTAQRQEAQKYLSKTQKKSLKALERLKKIYDAKGIFIHLENIPADHDYLDPQTGMPHYQISKQFPQIYLRRINNRWVFPKECLQTAHILYKETFPVDLGPYTKALPQIFRTQIFGIAIWQSLALLLLIFIGLGLRHLLSLIITTRIKIIFERYHLFAARNILHSTALPIGTFFIALLLYYTIPILAFPVRVSTILILAVRTLGVFSMVLFAYRIIDLFSSLLLERAKKTENKLDDQLIPLLRKFVKIILIFAALIFVLQNLEIDISGLLTGLGLGGLAFALAAKDVISNFFGSVTILLDRPFQIGDWITSDNIEGIVEDIGIRSTRVRSFHNSLITVPNGHFTDAIVDNLGLRHYRRCSTRLSLIYSTSPEQIEAFCEGIRAIIKNHPKTRKDYFEVHFNAFAASSLEILLYFFFKVPSWSDELRAKHEVFLQIMRLAEALKIEFAFPTQDIHIRSMPSTNVMPTEQNLNFKDILQTFKDSHLNTKKSQEKKM